MRLYFVRHGESEANVTRQFSNKDDDIHPLTARGIEQAEALAEKLRDVPLVELYASPMLRARQTAEILNAPHSLPIQITTALREHDAGDLEGRMDADAWNAYTKLFEQWMAARDLDARMPNGESFNEMRARFVPFISNIVTKYENKDTHILLVGHAGIFHSMLPLIFANVGYTFAYRHILENTGLVVAEQQQDGLVCLEWNGIRLSSTGTIIE